MQIDKDHINVFTHNMCVLMSSKGPHIDCTNIRGIQGSKIPDPPAGMHDHFRHFVFLQVSWVPGADAGATGRPQCPPGRGRGWRWPSRSAWPSLWAWGYPRWLVLVFLYDGGRLFLLTHFSDYPLDRFTIGAILLNPVDLERILVLMQLDASVLLGYTGAIFRRFFGTTTGILAALMAMKPVGHRPHRRLLPEVGEEGFLVHEHPLVVPQSSQTTQVPFRLTRMDPQDVQLSPV